MIVTIADRLVIMTTLPAEDNFVGMALNRDIREKVKLTQELIEKAEIVSDPTRDTTTWKKEHDVEIEFTSAELEHLNKVVTQKDQERTIKEEQFNTFKKIREAAQAANLPKAKPDVEK